MAYISQVSNTSARKEERLKEASGRQENPFQPHTTLQTSCCFETCACQLI